uniref:Uncharacterized protein n=1 Tax=Romanomermis culicivorax TaxID=13658 RepID=A0A915L0E9_ROMCU
MLFSVGGEDPMVVRISSTCKNNKGRPNIRLLDTQGYAVTLSLDNIGLEMNLLLNLTN